MSFIMCSLNRKFSLFLSSASTPGDDDDVSNCHDDSTNSYDIEHFV